MGHEISSLKSAVSDLKGSLSNHQFELKVALEDFSRLKSLVATIREEFARNLTTEKKGIFDLLDKKIADLDELSSKHSQMIKRFEGLFEEIAIDSKNALLKAANAEMLVVLNKKKVENVQLLVQNQQLQK